MADPTPFLDQREYAEFSEALFRINLQNSPEGNEQQHMQQQQQQQQQHLQHPLTSSQLQQSQQTFSFSSSLPERPGEPDCVYFLRTGQCGYGMACKFNHPSNRTPLNRGSLDYPERPGQPECQYFLKTGTCKFGSTCKYDHPKEKAGIGSPLLQQQQHQQQQNHQQQQQAPLNFAGLPIRVGEKECAFYMKTGLCKYGQTCRFHHPPLTSGSLSLSPSMTPNSPSPSVQSMPVLPWQMHRPPQFITAPRLPIPGSFPTMMMPTQPDLVTVPPSWSYQSGMPQTPSSDNSPQQQGQGAGGAGAGEGSHPYLPHVPMEQPLPNPGSPYQSSHMYPSPSIGANAHSPYQTSVSLLTKSDSFPQRMGQPECQYYMKTGDCKFGITCKFHHPKDRALPSPTSLLSVMGLPLRPGVQACPFYVKYGICKFGHTCKFDHPVRSQDYSQTSQLGLQQGMQSNSYLNMPTYQYQYSHLSPGVGVSGVGSVGMESHSEVHQPEVFRSENTPHSSDSSDHQIYSTAAATESSSS